jgi:hypothetical protein
MAPIPAHPFVLDSMRRQKGYEMTILTQRQKPPISAIQKRLDKGGVMIPRAETIVPAALRPGSSRCQCGRCGLTFSALSNFDAHQTLDPDGNVQCWDPSSIGLVCREGVWGRPGDPSRFAKDGADAE